MEEFEFKREAKCDDKTEVAVKMTDVDIGWGFRLKQESVEEKTLRLK